MTEKNSNNITGGKMQFIDFWSIIYLLIVCAFTLIFEQANIIVYGIYLVCALPFFNCPDKFVCVCFVLSTMSYFFLGADEGVWSLYTILAIMLFMRMLTDTRASLSLKSFALIAWMAFAVFLSYSHSEFGYYKGMFAMFYNIAISVLIAMTVIFEEDTVKSFLPKIAAFQIVVYIVLLIFNGYYDGYGFSISPKINHNTFGVSVAILSVILLIKIVYFHEKTLLYKILWVVSLALSIVVGSRNALLAAVLTSISVYMIYQKHQGKSISGAFKFLIFACIVVFAGSFLLPQIGVDLTRFNYVELIGSGGSNRSIIWETLSPIIWNDHRWFGYGPSHFCSEQMINSFMGLDYKHTHNTIFESWGELGFFGLIPFLLILIYAFKKSYRYIKTECHYLLFGFIFIEIILLGMGESLFANIELWIVIGILLSSKKALNKTT